MLDFNCEPCVSFGGFYCYDDPKKVNFNGDKCYEYAVDRTQCVNNYFSNDIKNCTISKFVEAPICSAIQKNIDKWEMPIVLNITLEPRSACGFRINKTAAVLFSTHKYPVTMH